MAPERTGHRAGAELTVDAFGVKRVVFSVAEMSGTAQRLLRKRLGSELDAVRDLIRKAELFPGAGPAGGGEAGARGSGEDGRVSSSTAEPHLEAPVEVDGSSKAKRRKVSPSVQRIEEQKRTTPDERARLAERLASLAAALPDHVIAFLQNERAGDADYRGDGSESEMGMQSMKDGALFQLKLLLDKFAPASTPKNHGRTALDASGVSCLSQHRQNASGQTGAVEKEGGVGICGGASRRIQLRDIAEEYGELVGAIGVLLLSPLPRKHVDLTEHDEYVDICGDASPVVFGAAKAVETGGSPSSSSSGSGASSSDSDSVSDSDENGSSPPPPPDFLKDDTTSEHPAKPPKQAPENVHIAEPEKIQHQCASPTPAVRPTTSSPPAPLVLPKETDIFARLPEAATKEMVHIAKAEELQNQHAAPGLAPTGRPIIGISPVPLALPKGNDTAAQPLESTPEAAHGVEPGEHQNQRAAVAAPTVRPINTSPPAPAALPNENGISAQPPPPASEAAHIVIVEPEEEPQDPSAAPAAAADDPLTNLIVKAQEAIERRRQEEKNRMREKARQELLEVERAALPDERIHPQDMELLGIAAFEHIVSTVEVASTARPRENGRVAPGCPTIMQFLGLFLKADDNSEEQESPPGVAPGGADMDVEEGEIR